MVNKCFPRCCPRQNQGMLELNCPVILIIHITQFSFYGHITVIVSRPSLYKQRVPPSCMDILTGIIQVKIGTSGHLIGSTAMTVRRSIAGESAVFNKSIMSGGQDNRAHNQTNNQTAHNQNGAFGPPSG